ncbi:GPR1/FUN34/yaaH family-domain-containing protein [Favolaschia claudopus]|uniref:GPR1/FUN34/yaaH family-domain-containing protein n=1 Tax=Favolaschia claudopus TaxID=2862362 RepID=A0AAW0DQE6_9AGAR
MSPHHKGSFHEHGAGGRLLSPSHPTTIGNPASLGLFSFASTTFILSFYNVSIDGVTHPNVVVGMALFCGGLAQLLAGMWEFPRGNVFGATAFTSYGAFWLSFGTIFIPGSGILSAEYKDTKELDSALGIYLFSWFIVTFLFLIASIRKSISFVALFGCLSITFMLLGISYFVSNPKIGKAGGAMGIITAFIAYYIGLSDLLAAEKAAVVRLPLGAFKHD